VVVDMLQKCSNVLRSQPVIGCANLLFLPQLVAEILARSSNCQPRPPSFPRQNTLNLEEFGVHASARMTACHAKYFAHKLTRRCLG
jgi:hypothetical protein